MKLSEQFIDGDGSAFHIKQTFDAAPALDEAQALKAEGVGLTGEHRCVGVLPGWLLDDWVREAGVAHNDNDAIKELIKRKMQSGDFAKLRVWEGVY